jgi:hypothetical protein
MLNLATRFINYCNKVYALDQRLSQVKDGRKKAQYSLPSLLMKMISGIVTGIRSFNQLEETVNHGIFDGIGDPDRPTADTFNYALTRLDLDSLTRVLDKIITDARHIREAKNVLAALIDSIPLNSNVMLKLEAPPMPQAEFKRRLEGIFVSVIWPQLQARFTTYAFQNFEGMQQVDVRTGDESGAWRILLSAPGRQAFVFVRGSRTEAGVWRMIIDTDDAEDFGILRPLAEEMFQRAGDEA